MPARAAASRGNDATSKLIILDAFLYTMTVTQAGKIVLIATTIDEMVPRVGMLSRTSDQPSVLPTAIPSDLIKYR